MAVLIPLQSIVDGTTSVQMGLRPRGIMAVAILHHGDVNKSLAGHFPDAVLHHWQENDINDEGYNAK